MNMHAQHPVPLVLQVRPSRAESTRDLSGLETAMQSLMLGPRRPLALEIAATATSRAFLVRAASPLALEHLAAQIQARYPQACLSEVLTDPLTLAPGEECSAVELLPGADASLPLRAFRALDLRQEGVDPLLGVLAAFHALPAEGRAIAHLALVPALPTWSAPTLQQQASRPTWRERQRTGEEAQAPGIGRIAVLFVLVVLLVLFRFASLRFPSWLSEAMIQMVHGKMPTLSLLQIALLAGGFLALCAVLVAGRIVFQRLARRLVHTPLPDPRLAAEKITRPAYRARLRLFVITPEEKRPLLQGKPATLHHTLLVWCRLLSASLARSVPLLIRACVTGNRHIWRSFALVSSPSAVSRGRRFLAAMGAWRDAFGRASHRARLIGRATWGSLHHLWREAWLPWHEWRGHQRTWKRDRRAHRQRRKAVLTMLTAAYGQYHTATGGYFVPKALTRRQSARLLRPGIRTRFLCTSGWSTDVARSTHYLGVADLAALWHLPQAQDLASLPYLEQRTMRTILAPPQVTTGNGYHLGFSEHAGQHVPVFYPYACLRQNLLAVASTGKGKSSLLLHLALARFATRTSEKQGGLLQIDVHGDLHRLTLASLPPTLEDAVVRIDLAEQARMIGLNPLDVSQGANRDKLVDNLITLVEAIWSNSYGPRTENILEYACKTLVEANVTLVTRDPVHGPDAQYTLLDVVPLLRDESFRHAVFEQVHDPYLKHWWAQYFEHLDARQQSEFSSSVVTKFSKFTSSYVARRILGQPRSTLSFGELIAQEKILLINCASGEVGKDIAGFLGAVLLGFFHMALAEQARLHPSARRHYLVLIDEFQALTGVDYQTMLAELRKYGGSFALATQSLAYLDRLDRSLRATVLANIDQLFSFNVSAEDAHMLRLDGIEEEDLDALPAYTCYARWLLDGQRLPLFSLHLDDPATRVPTAPTGASVDDADVRIARITQSSALRYARPVGEIDALLLSIQARQAEMMKLARRTRKDRTLSTEQQTSAINGENPATSTGAPRGKHRRAGSGKSASQGNTVQQEGEEPIVIPELFVEEPEDLEQEQETNEEEEHA